MIELNWFLRASNYLSHVHILAYLRSTKYSVIKYTGSEWFDIEEGALIIKNIVKRQQGTYTCLAKNRIGYDSSVYTVNVNGKYILFLRLLICLDRTSQYKKTKSYETTFRYLCVWQLRRTLASCHFDFVVLVHKWYHLLISFFRKWVKL